MHCYIFEYTILTFKVWQNLTFKSNFKINILNKKLKPFFILKLKNKKFRGRIGKK